MSGLAETAIRPFVIDRPHWFLELRAATDDSEVIRLPVGRIERHQVLGGLINEHERACRWTGYWASPAADAGSNCSPSSFPEI